MQVIYNAQRVYCGLDVVLAQYLKYWLQRYNYIQTDKISI